MALSLYVMGILEVQCTENLFCFLKFCVNIDPFSLIGYVSKNFNGLTSTINLMLF